MSDRMNDSARPFQRSVTASGMNRDRGSIEPNYYEGSTAVARRGSSDVGNWQEGELKKGQSQFGFAL